MKNIHLLFILLAFSATAQAQPSRVYHDEGFDTKKAERTYTIETPGQQFYNRMSTLYRRSDSGHITQNGYNHFLKSFEELAANYNSSNPTIAGKLKVLSTILNQINNVNYNIDGNRDRIYHIAAPVYKAAYENWGDEVVNTAIANAYFLLKEHIVYTPSDEKLQRALPILERNPISFGNGAEACSYTVSVSPQLAKDKIDIFFTPLGMYSKAAQRYPGMLLAGPISGWENNKDESESVMDMLKTYADMGDNSSIYIHAANNDKPGKYYNVKQDLNSDMKWFVWVFRNNKLYYSYMAEPCGMLPRLQVN
jgi:hypothetical protein